MTIEYERPNPWAKAHIKSTINDEYALTVVPNGTDYVKVVVTHLDRDSCVERSYKAIAIRISREDLKKVADQL